MLEQDFPVRVVTAFLSPLGLGLFEFQSTIQRTTLLDASPISFGHGEIILQRHDEAKNFRACNYCRQCWIVFLGFPLDHQLNDYIKAVVAPFGRLHHWFEGPNKSCVLTQCLIVTPERVPRSVVISQGTVLGGNGQSWTAAVYILDGQFPDAFPNDEDPVPANGNPHPIQAVPVVNPNVPQHWHHDLDGTAHHVHMDVGLNDQHMQDAEEDLQEQVQPDDHMEDAWPEWFPGNDHQDGMAANQHDHLPQHPAQPQHSFSFDQLGSTATYLRANGPDIVLRVEDVLAGLYAADASSGSSDSSESEVQSYPSVAFRIVEQQAFSLLKPERIQHPIIIPAINMILLVPEDASQEFAIIPYKPTLHALAIRI